MSQKTNAVVVRTIGIDTGKNTFHLIGLDEHGTIVLREKLARGRIGRDQLPSPVDVEVRHKLANTLNCSSQVPPTQARICSKRRKPIRFPWPELGRRMS